MNKDLENLRMLSIGYYIYAAILALFSCFPIIHVTLGISMLMGSFENDHNPPPAFVGWMFVGIGGLFILGGWATAICTFLAGKYIKQQKNYIFILVMAGISCMFAPLGTILGVFTFIVLLKDPVKQLFNRQQTPANYNPQGWQQ